MRLAKRSLVEVNLQVVGGAACGDDIGFAVGVEVGDADVLGGHLIVIDQLDFPLRTLFVGGIKQFHADFAGASCAAPTDDDLVAAGAEEVAGGQRVALVE